ncbi:MAG TPA: hypothetical protein DCG28_03845, partial [Lachnospiraceae bacterium]|nr:hypothetical protein [Lachnospiraceae bacterium]
ELISASLKERKTMNDNLTQGLSKLCNIALTDEEAEKMQIELEKIIDFMKKLAELDTDDLNEMSHPFEGVFPLREDKTEPSYSREEMLKNAKNTENGCYRVPKAIKEK